MAFSDDSVRAKLSSLQESQDSIVTVSQWLLFHKRYADRTAQLWVERLRDSSVSKKLNLIYLANEVVQQSKARKKDDFVRAFTPVIADATIHAYKGASLEVQTKLARVVAVWKERGVFPPNIIHALESQTKEIDQIRGPSKKARLGGALFTESPSHPDLQPITSSYASLTKVETLATSTSTSALTEYANQTGPDAPAASADARAGKLSALLKSLATAESNVGDAIKTRKALIISLETLLKTQNTKLATDELQLTTLESNKTNIEALKRNVEAEIMRNIQQGSNAVSTYDEPDLMRPEEEPLTPPAVESFTPVGSPRAPLDDEPLGFQGLAAPIPNPTGADTTTLETLPTFDDNMPIPDASDLATTAIAGLTQPTNVILDPRRAHLGDNTPESFASLPAHSANPHASPPSFDPRLSKRPRLGSGQMAGGNADMEFAGFSNDAAMTQMDNDVNALLNA